MNNFQKKWKECQFCRIARYGIVFALGIAIGFVYGFVSGAIQ